jgi:energy-coupling factor transporter transmembrane protein EcfT
MHAGFLILCWMLGVGALQFLQPGALALVVCGLAVVALLGARLRTLRLLRRVRILLIAIIVLFAGFTPGEAVLADWPALSPSREGLLQALAHAGRLVAVVCCVAILLERLSTERLIGGLYALSRPLAVFGLPAERVAVRMLLVLRYVDSPRAHVWRELLHEPGEVENERLQLQRERLGALEWGVLGVGFAYLLWAYA